ncbi:hypothetical protein B0T18DRAFT_406097 [Schizothecium vesticola]|uniref:Uncharacterized protein n=1 Tax=Schizothecium vesticola TaxID=314040 RepID=A0AA40F0Z3_9PEZI|nr:hypothetical protein B0T18DRAFT_406097 [Schizothecium vesticola]
MVGAALQLRPERYPRNTLRMMGEARGRPSSNERTQNQALWTSSACLIISSKLHIQSPMGCFLLATSSQLAPAVPDSGYPFPSCEEVSTRQQPTFSGSRKRPQPP